MRTIFLFLFTGFFTIASWGQTRSEMLSGRWKAVEKDLVIELYEGQDGLFYGKDSKGRMVLDHLRYDAKEGVYRGTLQPPDRPSPIPVTLKVESRDRLRLEVRKFIMTKTLYLIRWKKD